MDLLRRETRLAIFCVNKKLKKNIHVQTFPIFDFDNDLFRCYLCEKFSNKFKWKQLYYRTLFSHHVKNKN